MLRLFIIICCCLVQQHIISQTFNKASLFNASSFYFENAISFNDNYFFIGFGADKNQITLPQLAMLKTDKNGNEKIFHFFGDTLNGAFYSCEKGTILNQQKS